MDTCCICKELISDEKSVVIKEKGANTINACSNLRNDSLKVAAGDKLHQVCRREYTNQKAIKIKSRQTSENTSASRILRSKEQFNYKESCLFCSQPVYINDKRRSMESFLVRTSDFQKNIVKTCKERNNDWATQVLARIQYAQDLHAADAQYHQQCSVNFRTGKNVPSGTTPNKKKKGTGRPQREKSQTAFLKTVDFLIEHEDEQLTVNDMVNKMSDICGESLSYTAVHMKSRIQSHFGENIIITEINGRPNVITLRKTARTILQDFHHSQSQSDPEAEKNNILKTAANLIKSDIKSIISNKSEYPFVSDIESTESNLKYLPESLKCFLRTLFSESNIDVKLSSIGQSVIQATRPRSLIVPLQIWLAVQMHHAFGSRFLIDTLNALGFSSSYSEVQRYELNAAKTQKTDIPDVLQGGHLQYIADNVDHNIRTIDGHGTFHGMGIVATATPGVKQNRIVPRMKVDAEEVKQLARIDVKFYKMDIKEHLPLKFKKLESVHTESHSTNLSFLSAIVWPAKMIGWTGTCQMAIRGPYLGKSSVIFLPIIDMDPSNLTCIYSTLNFVSKEAKRHNSDPVLTFDQPLYWKAVNIIYGEQDSSLLKSIVVRLGGFHTEMSFLGSIGYLMNNSGLSEVLESVYAPAAVVHMLSGKAVARAIRGHSLVYTALTLLLVSETYDISTNILDKNQWTEKKDFLLNKENAGVQDETRNEDNNSIPMDLINLVQTFEHITEESIVLMLEISGNEIYRNRHLTF